MQLFAGISRLALLVSCLIWVSACSPEVGSDEWCAKMKEKPKQDWSAKDAADYTKYCVLKLDKK